MARANISALLDAEAIRQREHDALKVKLSLFLWMRRMPSLFQYKSCSIVVAGEVLYSTNFFNTWNIRD